MARGWSLVTACVLACSCANAENIIGGSGDAGTGGLDAGVGGAAGTTGGSAGVSSGGATSGGAAGSTTGGSGGTSAGGNGGSGGAVGGSGGAVGGSGGTSAAGGTGATGGAVGGSGGTGATGGTGGGTGGTGGSVGNPPPSPNVQGCTTCDCCDPWIVSWTPSTGATYYNVFWTCFIIEHTVNMGTVTFADLCDPLVGMCSSAECANGVASVFVQACNAGACSAKVPVTNGLPIACGGGCCC